jgi:hypothetical protein
MEENTNLFESLFEKAADYGKTSYELAKLKTIDKTSDVVSTTVPHLFFMLLIVSFMLFLNIGIAFWLGEILDKVYYGFFVVAGFYCILGLVLRLFMHKWIKNKVQNYFIKQVLK